MELLNGKEERIVVQDSKTGIGGREREAEIRVEEVGKQVGRLKRGKAPRRDGLVNEVWIFGTDGMIERLSELMDDVWTGKGFPREWRVGQIYRIHKKGSKEKVENYRGITLLNTAYKLYPMVLNERLVTEMNEKRILPENQAGFRRGRGAMDNVYILHHLIEKELLKEGGRVYALFVDLRAAFDTVDRECLWECMERRGLSEKLIVAAREVYRETVTSVRVGGIESEMFWTTKGLRQGCTLSPSLFACYIAIVVGREKVWCLAFADDLVILAKDECGMNEMKKNLQRYFKRKKLEVNVEKNKMIVFRKKGRKGEEKVWRWEDRIIDTVKEFKYLGFKFTTTNTVKAHIRERRVKAMQIMGMV
ncbi:hypothetical protein Zmor_021727 [Zophobas morio]|uniref:Reverse transcriptase domain-containing protein n=1 Tax=Zophobas morio TaxID=2755281 RepID=A0AA38I6Y5_9CUCU|nr:hypothetical protein Zmor_021727 [Zophobas morio]